MIRFEHIEFFYGFIAIPVFFFIYYIYRSWRRKKLRQIGDLNLIKNLIPNYTGSKPFYKFLLLILAYSALVVALTNPQIGTKMEEVKRQGVEIIIALDVSNSMLSEDIKPNRLERAKQEILKLIDNLQNDRISLIVFAGKSFTQLPLTTDYSAAKLMVSITNTDLISTQGTAIGSAIDLAEESFTKDNTKNKVLLIISDGENHEDDAVASAKKAADKGIVIYTFGMGSLNGAPIPIYKNGNVSGFMKDKSEQIIITKLNPQILQELSDIGNGDFFTADQMDLTALIEKIGKMDKQEFGTKMFTDYENRFQIFLGLALFLMLVEFIISEKRNKVINRISNLIGGYKK
jgi:Ca-activated chloride channel family protein